MDGHEHSDVVKEWEEFIEQIFNRFEWYVEHVHFSKHQMSNCCMLNKFDGFL